MIHLHCFLLLERMKNDKICKKCFNFIIETYFQKCFFCVTFQQPISFINYSEFQFPPTFLSPIRSFKEWALRTLQK